MLIKIFLQTLATCSLIAFINLSPVIGMEYWEDKEDDHNVSVAYFQPAEGEVAGDEEKVPIYRSKEKRKECCSSCRPSNLHWGLSRWIYGIWEYFERCVFCDTCQKRTDGLYPIYDTRNPFEHNYHDEPVDHSDCAYIDHGGKFFEEVQVCNNPIVGTLCCPLVAVGHLCTLPSACLNVNRTRYIKYRPPSKKIKEEIKEARFKAEKEKKYPDYNNWGWTYEKNVKGEGIGTIDTYKGKTYKEWMQEPTYLRPEDKILKKLKEYYEAKRQHEANFATEQKIAMKRAEENHTKELIRDAVASGVRDALRKY